MELFGNITAMFVSPCSVLASGSAWVQRDVQAFLNELNSSGGKSMEQLSPQQARQVLISAQAKSKVDLSGIDISEKTIIENGQTIKLNIVRPSRVQGTLPPALIQTAGDDVLRDEGEAYARKIRCCGC